MKRLTTLTLTAVLGLAMLPAVGAQKVYHPGKEVFRDRDVWKATVPGDVKLKSFAPFRAVYDRQYTQGSGSGAGQKRRDRVLITAEKVGWDGQDAVSITVIDSGDPKQPDTNARSLTMIVNRDTMGVLFEMGPVPGKAKDYYLGRVVDGKQMLLSMVDTGTQTLTPQKMPVSSPGFGPGIWAMASMELKQGAKIKLAPYYSPRGNPISFTDYGHVAERATFTDGAGSEYDAWIIETSGYYSFENPKISRIYVTDRPPYYLGTENVNRDTGEANRFVWLKDFQLLKD